MAITSKCKIALRPGTMFCFGTISSIADEEGTLHHVADLPEKKLSLEIPRGARAEQQVAPPPASPAKITSYKPKVESSPTRKTPLSTSPTKEWTQITEKKEANILSQGTRTRGAIFPTPSTSKEDGKKSTIASAPFYSDVLFIEGRLESAPISDDEPTMQGEEPPQREARRRRNRRRNIRRHHEARERDPAQPVSCDEALEVGETPGERVHRDRRNSHRRDRQQAQERE
jgi:hypothetical protein